MSGVLSSLCNKLCVLFQEYMWELMFIAAITQMITGTNFFPFTSLNITINGYYVFVNE